MQPFYTKVVKLVPYTQLVNRIDPLEPDNKDNGDRFWGFNDVSLYEMDGNTKVVFSSYMRVGCENEMTADEVCEKYLCDHQDGYLKPLKAYVESRY